MNKRRLSTCLIVRTMPLVAHMDLVATPLLTDLYQLNMIQTYLEHGQTKPAVFEFFVRRLPTRRGFLVAAGLEQALDFLEGLRFLPRNSTGSRRAGGSARTSYVTLPDSDSRATSTPCPRARRSSPTSRSCA
jgi:hypothetical protein